MSCSHVVKVSVYIGTSLDGFIARENGDIDWLDKANQKVTPGEDFGFHKLLESVNMIVMGRKTFESIGKPLPGRTTVIVTRQGDYKQEGCIIVSSIDEALKKVPEGAEACVVGGADIFKQVLPITDVIFLTIVHEKFEADTFFPEINWNEWTKSNEQHHEPDEKNKYSYTFSELRRK